MGDLLIHGLGELATARGSESLSGAEQGRVDRLPGAVVLCRDGRIAFVVIRRGNRIGRCVIDGRWRIRIVPFGLAARPARQNRFPVGHTAVGFVRIAHSAFSFRETGAGGRISPSPPLRGSCGLRLRL